MAGGSGVSRALSTVRQQQPSPATINRAAQVAKNLGREIGPLPGRYAVGGPVLADAPAIPASPTAQPVEASAPIPPQARVQAPPSAFAGYSNRLGANSGDHPGRISQRTPKRGTEAVDQDLMVDTASSRRSPKTHEHNVRLLAQYPGMPVHLRAEDADPDEILGHFHHLAKDNLKFLHEAMPPEIRERSKLWYKGGRRIVDNFAKRYNMPDSAVAGVLASLSPQKDWYQNVSLAERVLDSLHNQHNVHYTKEMEDNASRIFFKQHHDSMLDAIRGKRLSEIDDPTLKAMFIRLHDESHNPRWHRLVTPEGKFGRVRTNKDELTSDDEGEGEEPEGAAHVKDPSQTSWGSLSEITKAVLAAQSKGSKGELSRLMGERHKVRNFYNNLLAPDAPHGDVTIDTHAIAASLMRPLGGSATEVSHNFGNNVADPHKKAVKAAEEKGLPVPERTELPPVAAKGSDITGMRGTYGLHADAYRDAAKDLQILPRELQSITWEGVRGLFTPEQKRNRKLVASVDEIWNNVSHGRLTADAARQQILALARRSDDPNKDGKLNDPTWFKRGRSGAPDDERAWDTSYERGVPASGAHGEPAPVAPGTGGEPARAFAGLEPAQMELAARARQLARATRVAHGAAGRTEGGLPATYTRRAGRSGALDLAPDFPKVSGTYEPHPEAEKAWSEAGISSPAMHELKAGLPSAAAFHEALMASKGTTPHGGAVQAYSPKEYAKMKLFLSPDRATGFALKGDDIISMFNNKQRGPHRNVANALLDLAVQQGGRKLDAYDTHLPHIYSRNRFHAVTRLPWDDEQTPPDWDPDAAAPFNGGRPDVVHMAYDPLKHDFYNSREGEQVGSHSEAGKRQAQAVKTYGKRLEKIAAWAKRRPKKASGGTVGSLPPSVGHALGLARRYSEARA